MLRKYAVATVIDAYVATKRSSAQKTAHRAVFNYEPRPGYLYVRSRMISSRCNDNHDEFPAEEIRKAWKTAIGKPVFVNHHNEDHKRMRGVIIDAALHEDTLPDGRPDVWIEALHEIDAQRFPKLAQAIIEGRVNRTSMGTDVGYSICSACGNKATTPAEYCQHIPQMKGKILYRHTASGQREGHLIREICYKLGFFENSFLVEDPADPTAVVTGVDDRGLRATASLTKEAAPEGMRFRFTRAEHHPNRKHFLKATLPDEEGRHREVGYLMWEPHDGQVSMVQTDYDKRGQGIASALWHRAHEVAGQHGLTPPRHSDVQTPDGMEWAQKVDQQPIHAPGHGQQSLFEVPPEQGGTEVAGVPRPRHDDLFDHLLHDHAEWGRESVEQMRDSGSLESAHQRLHANPEMFPGRHFHIHGVKSSLPKVAEYDVPCERPGCGTHWGPHGAAGLLIHHDDPEDGQTRYLLQKRAPWVDHGGTWGIPGGALHEGESPEEGARREAEEEMGELPDGLVHHRTHSDDHGGWVYHTVRMRADEPFHPGQWDDESTGHGWFTRAEMRNMDLHPGFAQSLPEVLGEHRKESSLPSIEIEAARYDKHQHPGLMRDEGDIHMRNPHRRPSSLPSLAFRKGAPFAGYEDFEDCEEKNADKEDPEAYCGEIKKRTEGRRSSLPRVAVSDEEIQRGLDLPTVEQGHQDIKHQKAKDLAEHLIAPLYEPHGGHENYLLHMDNESMQHLQNRYRGGTGRFAFDEEAEKEGERAEPYYEIKHTTPQGRHTGWSIRHYADGPYAEIRHDATPGESHDIIDIGRPLGPGEGGPGSRHQPPDDFGHNELAAELHHWVNNDESGAREHLEGPYGDARIRQFKRRYPHGKLPPRQSSLPRVAYGEELHKQADYHGTLYHGTNGDGARGIMRSGLQEKSYLTPDADGARMFAQSAAGCYDWADENDDDPDACPHEDHEPPVVLAVHGIEGEGLKRDVPEVTAETLGHHTYVDAGDYVMNYRRVPPEKITRHSSLPKIAYGETKAPQDVDTLRTESCPVCGEVDAFDGDRCQVCNFLQPPAMFTDPDTGVARQMELRKDEMGQQAQIGPDGQPVPGQEGTDPNDPLGQDPAMQGLPGQAEDGVADLFCPACGFSADTQAPMTNNDPSLPSGQQGLLAGDVCPNCGEATMLSPNDVGMLGGEVPQEIADDANANGVPDDQEGEMPVDEGDLDGDGVPDDVEEGELDEEADAEAEADAVEDEDEAPKGRKDNTRRAARRG